MHLQVVVLILFCLCATVSSDAYPSAVAVSPNVKAVRAVSETLRSMAKTTRTDGWYSGEHASLPRTTLEPAFATLGKVFHAFERYVSTGCKELEAINELIEMANVTFELQRKVTELRASVDLYKFNDTLHTYASNINELKKKYENYMNFKSSRQQMEFKRECDKIPGNETLVKALYKTLFGSNLALEIIDRVVMRNTKFDPRRYAKFAQYLVAEMTLGAVLTTACVGVLEHDNENKTAKDYASSTITSTLSFAALAEWNLRETWAWTFSESSMEFKMNLEEEMRVTTRQNQGMSHETFVHRLSSQLREKYTFAYWTVLAYDHHDSRDWHRLQSNNGRVIWWTRSDGSVGRNVIVAWAWAYASNKQKEHELSRSVRIFSEEVGRTAKCLRTKCYSCFMSVCACGCLKYQYEEAWQVHSQLWTAITRGRSDVPTFLLTARTRGAYSCNESYAAIRYHHYRKGTGYEYMFFIAH